MSFVVASAAYPMGSPLTFEALAETWEGWLSQASTAGARLAVFPEYGAIEAALPLDRQRASDLAGQIEIMTAHKQRFTALWRGLAIKYQMIVVAPSLPLRLEEGRVVNRVFVFSPAGEHGFQDKLMLTPFERDEWGLAAGAGLKIFESPVGRFAVLICYDCEFPLLARAAVAAGAELLVVPSATDTVAGYWRVRIGAMARALEGQCYVVQSVLLGASDWSPSTDISQGAAGVYGPPDSGFPDDGLIALGQMNEPGWVYGEIDLDKVARVRAGGAVRPFQHWPEQQAALGVEVEPVKLC